MSNSFGHRITTFPVRPDFATTHCLAGSRVTCKGKPEFLLLYSYLKRQPSKHGTKEYEIQARTAACLEHAKKFAKKHKLEVPA